MKIQTKIMLLITALVMLVVGGVVSGFIGLQRRQARSRELQKIDSIMAGVIRTANESLAAEDDLMLLSYLRFQMKEYPELELCLVTSDGHTAILGEVRTELIYRTATVYSAGAGAAGEGREKDFVTIQLGFSRTSVERQLRAAYASLLMLVLGAAGLGILLGLLGSWWVSRRLARPVTDLSAAVQKFGAGELETSVAVSGRDEIAVLGSAFNRMAENIRESVRMKEDLLSTLTHELNNPLAGLKSYLALLRDPGKPFSRQAAGQAYDSMAEAFEEMELTLSNALELFRTSAQPVLEPEKLDIGALAAEAARLYRPAAAAAGIDLRIAVPAAPVYMLGDRKLLRRAVVNLISNALKYTPAGGSVKASVAVAADPDEMLITVEDTGYGIAPEDQPHLFTKFYRAPGSDGKKRRIPGTGLGLAISKQAVELHRGRIWVESRKGKGSTFYISVPRKTGETL